MKWQCGGGGVHHETEELRRGLIFALRINKVSA